MSENSKSNVRKKKVIINAVAGFILQGVMIVYGFVFPRLVMAVYGSGVNGVLQSITQFLSYIALLDAGVSAVFRAHLYKPLASVDYEMTQTIVNSAREFYKRIALAFLGYAVIVAVFLPLSLSDEFDYLFVFSLVIIIGISTFAEYFFGISYQVLLEADQRKYIILFLQSFIVVINTVLTVIIINLGASIHLVKLLTAFLFLCRPIIVSVYCKKYYKFTKNNHKKTPIKNKWAGMGHHLAYFLHTHTDIVLLTFAQGPLVVSVYGVYNMIVSALRQVLTYLTGGIEAAFGNMIAKKETENLRHGLDVYELLIFSCTCIIFTTASVTIIDFVKVYTHGVTDINYIRPVAAILLIIAEALYCIRKPYEALVMASGKLKETMKGAFVEVIINVLLSVILVWQFSIAGVAVGTVVAMLFRTIQYMYFVSKEIVPRKRFVFFVKLLLFGCAGAVTFVSYNIISVLSVHSYLTWIIKSLIVFSTISIIVIAIDFIAFRNDAILFVKMVKSLFSKKKKNRGRITSN